MTSHVRKSLNRRDLMWLAGYLEGEGYFGITGRSRSRPRALGSPRIKVSAVDRDVVEKAGRLMGGKVRIVTRTTVTNKLVYLVEIAGCKAIELMKELLPHMGKRRAAKIRDTLIKAATRPGTPHGELHGQAKLKDADVLEIRRLAKKNNCRGMQTELALKYGVSQASIWYIIKGRSWKHVA